MLYAVGDLHGERAKLDQLLDSLPLRPEDSFVFVGDYIDRGPDSAAVVDRLIELSAEHRCEFLLGNHESMFLDFLGWKDDAFFGGDAFLMNGGDRTLASYGFFDLDDLSVEAFELPESHTAFYEGLKLWHAEGDYLFVHAGVGRDLLGETDPAFAMRRAQPEELLWDRSCIDLPHELGVTVVYGHTPSQDLQVRVNPPFSIGIDTGAVYGGPLTAVRLPDEQFFQV